ncbi:MAG TPA: hypothetical protein PLL53_21540 [Saprospiraceae bacterium]|nr:hypothetical protein [Saprospiraceae bacterium]
MMKRFTLLTLLLLPALAFAQAPQAFSYQAIATDNLGKELTNRAIGIRAAVLQGSPSGAAVWVETHAVSTDEFGLFTLSIGQGTPQSGTLPAFANIAWEAGPYFLRIDMDPDGGTAYNFVGTSPLLSVPYALYSQKSGSADRAVFADSSAVAGLAQRALLADSAAVAHQAQRAVLADSAALAGRAQSALLADSAIVAGRAQRAILADSSIVAHHAVEARHAIRADTAGFSELAVLAANAFVADYANNAGTANSAAYANNAGIAQFATLAGSAVDDFDKDSLNEIQTLSISRDTIRISNGNFVALNAVSPFNAPGATFDFPEGIDHAFFLYVFNSYTVPAGRNFYITASQSEVRLPGVGNAIGRHFTNPSQPLIPAGTTVSNCRCTGFLVNQTSQINPVVIVLQPNGGNSYQVPIGRYLVIKSGTTATMPVSYDGTVIDFFSSNLKAMIAPSGVTLRNPNAEEIILTGYLKNNN